MSDDRTIDLERVAALVMASEIPAVVEQTGGGCATLFAGVLAPRVTSDGDTEDRYVVAAGPGWFEGGGFVGPRASIDEFYIGPDDMGESMDEVYTATEGDDEETLAAEIVRQVLANLNRGER